MKETYPKLNIGIFESVFILEVKSAAIIQIQTAHLMATSMKKWNFVYVMKEAIKFSTDIFVVSISMGRNSC
jgi:hypothetical protein